MSRSHPIAVAVARAIPPEFPHHCPLCVHWPCGEETVLDMCGSGSMRLTHPEDYRESTLALSKDELIAKIMDEISWALWYTMRQGVCGPEPVTVYEHLVLPHWRANGKEMKDMNVPELRGVLAVVQELFENLC